VQIKEFAFTNRLKTKKVGEVDLIPGKYGEIAEMGDSGCLRLRLLAVPRSANMTGALRNRLKQADAGDFKIRWRGDSESIWTFDPTDKAQAALAIRLVAPKRKRLLNLTDEQRQGLRDRLQLARSQKLVLA
jgi:hypothetical protein